MLVADLREQMGQTNLSCHDEDEHEDVEKDIHYLSPF